MTLASDEFIRRFLLHVLPDGFHRIRHYSLFASAARAANIVKIRSRLAPVQAATEAEPAATDDAPAHACPCCGGRVVIVERFRPGEAPRMRPNSIRLDTS